MTWAEQNPNATRVQRIEALARSMAGTAPQPSEATLEWYGLEPDFEITDEPIEHCRAFDEICMRCESCDWWCETYELEDGVCEDCR